MDKIPGIGVDFDNTICCYDGVFIHLARLRGMEPERWSKKGIRDWLRRQPGGEEQWRLLQGEAYGPEINHAQLMPGVDQFFSHCRSRGIPLFIVSHKTRFANFGPQGCDLRKAATEWMVAQGFFQPHGWGLRQDRLFFESTREEKLRRIASLAPSHFIDDLPEVLCDPEFPIHTVRRILFHPDDHGLPQVDFPVFGSWQEIQHHLFS